MSRFSPFEIVMLVCFGAAWPFSIYRSLKSRAIAGKSLVFLVVIVIGYAAGVLHKLIYRFDIVIYLYMLNAAMVLTDIILYLRNRLYHIRESLRERGGSKRLVLYRSRYGTTERYARWLAERLDARAVDLRQAGRLPLADCELILLGTAVYAGSALRGVASFCERNRAVLAGKPVGLFICCLYEGEKAQAQLQAAFPEWLFLQAFGGWALGGEILLKKLRPLDRFLARRVAGVTGDVSRVKPEALEPIVARVRELTPGR